MPAASSRPSHPRNAQGNASAPDAIQRFFDFSLLGMATSGFLAIFGSGELDTPSILLSAFVLLLRAVTIAGWIRYRPSNGLVAAITTIFLVFVPADYYYVSGSFLPVLVHMILFVAGVKILTAETARDYQYVKVTSVLELLAAALLSNAVSFFACLAAFLLFAVATMASGEVLRSRNKLAATGRQTPVSRAGSLGFSRRLATLSGATFVGTLVLTGGMFFLLPRTARAALQRFVPERYHLPGFSNEVTLGEIGEIKQSNTVVMHIRSYESGGLLAVHWRGGTLAQFDGKRWFNPREPEERLVVENGELVLPPVRHARPGRSVRYEVRLSEIASDTLFFAGAPETISIDARALWRSPSGSLRAPRSSFGGLTRDLRYAAYSYLEDERGRATEAPLPLTQQERRAFLRLPVIDARIPALAREWTSQYVTSEEQAAEIEHRFRTTYGYTLQLLPSAVADPLANFLFERKAGHCEYFASAMAVMLRTLGIPSRVATGFLSGVHNPMTGWQVVRASDAHSWVEAWIPGKGWTTFDPTPADPGALPHPVWSQLNLMMDAVNQFWHDWIVGYDFEHQLVLAGRMQAAGRNARFEWPQELNRFAQWQIAELRPRSWQLAGGLLLVLAVVLFGRKALGYMRRRTQLSRAQRGIAQASDATLLYRRALALLARRDLNKQNWQTPAEFAHQLHDSEYALLMEDLTRAYYQVRFGGQSDAAPRMARLLEQIEALAAR